MGNQSLAAKAEKQSPATCFTEEELIEIKKCFYFFSEGSPHIHKQKMADFFHCTLEEVTPFLNFFDIDRSGQVDYYRFICGLAHMRQANLDEKARIFFDITNFDGSRVISKDELAIFLKIVYKTMAGFHSEPNPSHDFILRTVDDYIKRFDRNDDDQISYDEFRRIFYHDEKVYDLLKYCCLITKLDAKRKKAVNEADIFDPDIEKEVSKHLNEPDEREERIKQGIEHHQDDVFGEQKEVKGDQSQAIKPWMGAVRASQPSNYQRRKGDADPPPAYLELEYVYGYRCHDTRNNLRYSAEGKIVYHTAAVGIVLDRESNKQQFFMEHTDDILCLDVCQNLVATGQIGRSPTLSIWDSATMQSLFVKKEILEKGISNVAISPDCRLVAAVGLDPDHTAVVYDISKVMDARKNPSSKNNENIGLVATGKTTKAEVFHIKFAPDSRTLVVTGNKETIFIGIDEAKNLLKGKNGLFGGNKAICLCVEFFAGCCVTGLFKGGILCWKQEKVVQTIKDAHKGSVNCMYSTDTVLITGGNDAMINFFDKSFKKVRSINVQEQSKIKSMNPKIRSLCMSPQGKILVGLRGGEVVEFEGEKPEVLVRGHFEGELWGMEVHPTDQLFYTVGEDCLLACWDIATHKCINKTVIQQPARTIHISANGEYGVFGGKMGLVGVFDPRTLKIVKEIRHEQEITLVKFSPKAERLMVAISPPNPTVLIYDLLNDFKLTAKMRGSPSKITHLDFSVDGKTVQLNNTSYEILYYDSLSGRQESKGASDNKDEKWSMWSCIIGWPVQGIWPPCSDGSDINTVHRNNKQSLLITGDDFGKVKVFKYPSAEKNAGFTKVGGHSAHVTGVRFSANDKNVISIGGDEKSIFQWKVVEEEVEVQQEPILENEDKGGGGDMFGEEEVVEGDQMGAMKPFMGQVLHSVPSWYKKSKKDDMLPAATLKLHHAFGYRCFDDRRDTARFLSNGKIVFITAGVGVVMDPKTKVQEFFDGHEEDIVSMAVHPQKKMVATGQMAAKGKAKMLDLFVWDSETKESFCNLNDFHRRQICCLSFSPDGTKLASVGMDDDNSVAVHDWTSKAMVANARVDKAKVMAVSWKDDNNFMTCGIKHIKFWNINGRNLKPTKGTPPSPKDFPFVVGTYAFNGDICVTGNAAGSLFTWKGGSCGKPIQAHKGEIGVLVNAGGSLYSGGGDGVVICWKNNGGNLAQQSKIVNLSGVSKYNPGIRAFDAFEGKFLVGTISSELFIIENDKPTVILEGHFDGEVWGCAASPKSHQFLTCGGDKTLRLWDVKTKSMVSGTEILENDVRAVDWASNGEFAIVGDVKGRLLLVDPKNCSVKKALQTSFKPNPKKRGDPWIEDLKISPNNDTLAVGAHGGNFKIEIFDVSSESIAHKMTIDARMSSALTHLDYSLDGEIIVINSQAYELLFFSISNGKDVRASAIKDTEWYTWTCTLGWPVQGIFPGVDGTDVNGVCRSWNKEILATGDDFGKVSIFKYPSVLKKSKKREYKGHSSHVTKVKFSFDDKFLFSTGGNDKAAMIWEVLFKGKGSKGGGKKQEVEEEEVVESKGLIKEKKHNRGAGKFKESKDEEEYEEDKIFGEEKEVKGDEFMAIKPWLGAIKEPSNFKRIPNMEKEPKVRLKLEHAYGYRVKDCTNNLHILKSGDLLYHAAALGIVLDMAENKQKFFNLHIDDITALDMHSDGVQVATGEVGAKPFIFVWDSSTMEKVHEFKGTLLKGITCLQFSNDGGKLFGSAIDDDHHIAIFDVGSKPGVLVHVKGGREVILDCVFTSETVYFPLLSNSPLSESNTLSSGPFPAKIVKEAKPRKFREPLCLLLGIMAGIR